MRADGTCADERWHLAYGERILAQATFVRPAEVWNSKMPVSVLNALAVHAASADLPWPQRLFRARLPTVALALVLGFLIWHWARALFGDTAGALALMLYTFCPNVLAHAHLVTTDISTSLAIFAATYAFWRYRIKRSRLRFALAAVAFGAAQLTKVTAIFLAPIFLVILGLHALRRRREVTTPEEAAVAGRFPRTARRLGSWVLFAGIALLTLNVGFLAEGTFTPLVDYAFVSRTFQRLAATPLLGVLPLPLPVAYVQGLDMVLRDAHAPAWSYLRGEFSETGFRSYFAWALLVKVPLATQLVMGIAAWLLLSGRRRAAQAEEFLVVPVVVLFAYLSLLFHLDIGLRYILPAFPFAFVFAGRAAALVAPGSMRRLGQPLLALLVLWLAVSSWSAHPHYIPYFNEIAGGSRHGLRWLSDSNLDWGQDAERVRREYAAQSPTPVLFDPSGPIAGRIAVGLTALVGRDPAAHARHAWLREHFTPVATVGNSWRIYDVSETDLDRCCPGVRRAQAIDDVAQDLALAGQPIGDGEGVDLRLLDRLNDGTLGAGYNTDAARSLPPRAAPVRAWFGVSWATPHEVSRIVAYPGYGGAGAAGLRHLAVDYVLQTLEDGAWQDIPGTRVTGNEGVRIEHRFPPRQTTAVRILIERERNAAGTLAPGSYRAACLEIAAYER